ncbi:hypothetical protein O1611_g942 [Lasiodiplodia mahajangana]|uniref:Uncharacterized protein n=1 Tax=Lasiodiplodia mahajangana TaxID=1108764 RepID=A0ACC2JYT2_9PEZI|nr:hypothetical protein O1611_g942 [Lasiodiplodia mahajangana]
MAAKAEASSGSLSGNRTATRGPIVPRKSTTSCPDKTTLQKGASPDKGTESIDDSSTSIELVGDEALWELEGLERQDVLRPHADSDAPEAASALIPPAVVGAAEPK